MAARKAPSARKPKVDRPSPGKKPKSTSAEPAPNAPTATVTADTDAPPAKSTPARSKRDAGTGGLSAAHRVLVDAKEPLRIRDITRLAIDNGFWKPAGKTPWATLAAAIGREIKDKGKQSRFKKTDRGLFAAVQPK